MGTAKMLLPLGDDCLVNRTIRTALRVCRRVILVQGAVDLRPAIPVDSRIVVVTNRRYREGQLTSIQTGLRAAETESVFLMLGDLPLVEPATYRYLYRKAGAGETVYPVSSGRRGHPVLVGPDALRALGDADPEAKPREILERMGARGVEVNDPAIYSDVDTMEAYHRIIHSDEGDPI